VLEPQKNFPRSLLSSVVFLIGVYLLANVGYVAALGPARTAAPDTIAASGFAAVLGPSAAKIIALTILIGLQFTQQRAAYGPTGVLRHGFRWTVLSQAAGSSSSFSHSRCCGCCAGSVVGDPCLCGAIPDVDQLHHICSLDFLRAGGGER
jgi:hypothetical protein